MGIDAKLRYLRVAGSGLRLSGNPSLRKGIAATLRFHADVRAHHPACRAAELRRTVESVIRTYDFGPAQLPVSDGESSLHILGSGPSIGELDSRAWECIHQHDSWGFNRWYMHGFAPSMYFYQTGLTEESDAMMGSELLESTMDVHHPVSVIRGSVFGRGRFDTSVFYRSMVRRNITSTAVAELYMMSRCPIPPDVVFGALKRNGFLDPEPNVLPVPKLGSTVMMLVMLAIRMRYQNVVLSGIDMNDTAHFFDSGSNGTVVWPVPSLDGSAVRERHPHLKSTRRPFGVVEQLVALAQFSREQFGTTFHVSSATSALHPHLPVYDFGRAGR